MGDDGHREAVVVDVDDGEADPVDRDRPLLHQVAGVGRQHGELGGGGGDLTHGVDVALHQVATQPVADPQWPLQVHRVARSQVAEVGPGQRLVDHVGGPPAGPEIDHREAAAVHRDRATHLGAGGHYLGHEGEPLAVAGGQPAHLLD